MKKNTTHGYMEVKAVSQCAWVQDGNKDGCGFVFISYKVV